MLDSFIITSLTGGLIVAALSGLLGSFTLWKNMAYFGDSLSHTALLGVTIGVLLNINISIAVTFVALIFALIFTININRYSNDTILGIISYSSLALALIINSIFKIKVDLLGYLFGDILAINASDIIYLVGCGAVIFLWVCLNWHSLLMLSLSEEYLHTSGGNAKRIKLEFSLILAIFIAISFKIVGIFLIIALLVIPAATALCFSKSPLQMIKYSILFACLSCISGLISSFYINTPTGPTIILASSIFFVFANIGKSIFK